MNGTRAPRVLIVDDSARSRVALAEALSERGIEVVGRAIDGRVALRMVLELQPDVVMCDLEMPKMDGFTFLRIVTHQRPVPVIMVTSDARPESAIQALELGARDFVVKPGPGAEEVAGLGDALASRIFALTAEALRPRSYEASPEVSLPGELDLVVIGASTGGPRALRDLFSALGGPPRLPILVAQHMPPRFTAAFAARLKRVTGLDVEEARDGEVLRPGVIRVGPGNANLLVRREGDQLRAILKEPAEGERLVPNVDRLFASAVEALQARVLALVLTGMGRDGAKGAKLLAAHGAHLWTESPATAVIDGMPAAASAAHPGAHSAPLDVLGLWLARVVDSGPPKS